MSDAHVALKLILWDPPVPPPQPVAGPSQLAPTYLPTPSNTSVHSKSRFSLRSSRSGFTARSTVSHMSRLFRRGGSSAPAPNTSSSLFNVPPKEEGGLSPLPLSSAAMIAINSNSSNVIEGNGSVRSIPVSVGRKLGKKGSIPQDWKELQDLHYKETQREEAKARSIRSEKSSRVPRGSKTVSVYIHEEGTEMEQPLVPSSYRTMRRASASANPASPFCSSDNVRASVIHPALSASTTMTPSHSNSSLSSYSKSDLEGKSNAHSGDRCSTRPASLRTARASTIHEVENLSSMPTSSLVIVQPGDEALNSIELREAIASLKEENARLVIQFSDLEASLQEKYGDPALEVIHLSAQQRRRESLSMSYLETGGAGRRLSTSSSLFSASQGRNSMMGQYVAGGGSLQPGSSMVRRPSKTSSIASSSMRRGLNSSGSTHPGSYETHMTSRPPSTVQEELLFEAIDAAIDSEIHPVQMQTHPLKDPQYEKEYQTLQERKKNIEERYAARLEYLEARLKGQLMKEKLRR